MGDTYMCVHMILTSFATVAPHYQDIPSNRLDYDVLIITAAVP